MGDPVEDEHTPNGKTHATVDASQLISQLKAVAENPDVLKGATDAQLQDLQRYAREAGEQVEKPFETLRRIAYSVSDVQSSSTNLDHARS